MAKQQFLLNISLPEKMYHCRPKSLAASTAEKNTPNTCNALEDNIRRPFEITHSTSADGALAHFSPSHMYTKCPTKMRSYGTYTKQDRVDCRVDIC